MGNLLIEVVVRDGDTEEFLGASSHRVHHEGVSSLQLLEGEAFEHQVGSSGKLISRLRVNRPESQTPDKIREHLARLASR